MVLHLWPLRNPVARALLECPALISVTSKGRSTVGIFSLAMSRFEARDEGIHSSYRRRESRESRRTASDVVLEYVSVQDEERRSAR